MCTVGLCAWFFVHTAAFASVVQQRLDRKRPSPITFERFEYGPSLERVVLYGVVIRDRSATPQLVAATAEATIDWSSSDFGGDAFSLRVNRLEIHDFNLALVWNRFGKLKLTEGFRTRAMDAVETKPPPPKPFSLELADIVLRAGTLDLAWEAAGFGFRFHEIAGVGNVSIAPGDFQLEVARLGADDSAIWFTNGADELSKRFASLPENRASKDLQGARIPLQSVEFQNFRWKARGFSSELAIALSDSSTLRLEGMMEFGSGKPPRHSLTLESHIQKATVAALSREKFHGELNANIRTEGVGGDALFEVSNVSR